MLSTFLAVLFGCSTLISSALISSALATTPPNVEPSPKGDVRNKSDSAIIIGNENYYRLPQAIYATNDAVGMAYFMRNTRQVSKYKLTQVTNGDQEEINKALKKYYRRTGKNGTLWIYFAGHGYTDRNGNRYLLPVDVDPNKPLDKAIEVNDIFEATSKKGNRVVIIADAGFGHTGRDGLPVFESPLPLPYDVANNDPDRVLWIPDTRSVGNPAYIQAQHSLFTYLILGGVRGWADGELDNSPDSIITMGELQEFVKNKMLQLGQPSEPSVFVHDDVQYFPVHSSMELEKMPNDAVFEELSIGIRMRNFANQAELLRAEATERWNDVLYDVQKGGTQGEEALKRYLEDYERTAISVEWMVHIPQTSEARRMLRNYENLGNIVAFDPEICTDLIALEPEAQAGALGLDKVACLEGKLRLERLQSEKSKISVLLINNDMANKDLAAWETRMRYHLQSIDRSQPDFTMSFARYLQKSGSEFFKEALYWTNYTMETRTSWPDGEEFKRKSNQLYKLRANLALAIWMEAEDQYIEERTPELDQVAREAKGLAKDLSREWLDYAKQAGLDTQDAFNICMSTSSDPDFCKD